LQELYNPLFAAAFFARVPTFFLWLYAFIDILVDIFAICIIEMTLVCRAMQISTYRADVIHDLELGQVYK